MDLNSDIILRIIAVLGTTLTLAYFIIKFSFNSKTDEDGDPVVDDEEIDKRSKRKRNLFLVYGIVFLLCILLVLLKHF